MRFNIPHLIIAAGSMVLTMTLAVAQDAPAPSAKVDSVTVADESDIELDAIRKQSQAFTDAFNKRDAKAIAALWTKTGEYVDDAGQKFIGRDAIEKGFVDFFTSHPNGELRVAIDSLRLIGPTMAIEEGSAVIEPQENSTGLGKYTAVHAKTDGQWLMVSVRDESVEAPLDVRSAADLEWLVGTWVAEEQGVRTESVCQWVAGGRFLERKYTTTQVNGTTASGVQIIGWNPQQGCVQSWDFSSSGGHAIGAWQATEGGWQADVRGTTAAGVATVAVNVLKRLDDNAYVWQSVRRSLGDAAIPDTDEVVIKRQITR